RVAPGNPVIPENSFERADDGDPSTNLPSDCRGVPADAAGEDGPAARSSRSMAESGYRISVELVPDADVEHFRVRVRGVVQKLVIHLEGGIVCRFERRADRDLVPFVGRVGLESRHARLRI